MSALKYRVTLLVGIFPPAIGGPAIFAERFQRWCVSRGVDCHVITYSTYNIESTPEISRVKLGRLRIYSFLKFFLTIIKKSNKSNLILANGCFLEIFFASFFLKKRYVVKLPGDPLWEFAKNHNLTSLGIEDFQSAQKSMPLSLLMHLYSKSYRRAKVVICPSMQLLDFAQNWGVRPENLRLIYNSVDPKLHEQKDIFKPEYDLVTISRLVTWKNIDQLIQLVAELDLSLLIAGDGPEFSNLKAFSEALRARVTFLGNVENKLIPGLLSKARCFVLNSEFEASSYSLIEAKMVGTPVVARASAGSSEVIRNGIDGFLYDNLEELKIALKRVLSNNFSQEFSNESYRDALSRFNQEINFFELLAASGDFSD